MSEMDYTYQELNDKGIDTSMIKSCKKIRNLAKLDRLELDMTEHRSGLNKHLFDYLLYCGYDLKQFIKDYLSNLQPYMIERRLDQESSKSFICVIDKLYRVSVYIKADTKQFEEIVISFHEDNKRGIAKTNEVNIYQQRPRYVPVFADSCSGKIVNENRYTIKVFIQRGLVVFPIELVGMKAQDVYIVSESTISQEFLNYCNEYIRDLYTSDLDLDFTQIEVFSFLQQISFTSYGRDTFSSMSLLIDNICVQKDLFSRLIANSALVIFTQNLKLTEEQKEDLINLLETKFRVTSIKGIDTILQQIKDNLTISSVPQLTVGVLPFN